MPGGELVGGPWEALLVGDERLVDVHIGNLRRKLDAVSPEQELIRSIYGVGYKLEL